MLKYPVQTSPAPLPDMGMRPINFRVFMVNLRDFAYNLYILCKFIGCMPMLGKGGLMIRWGV